MVAIFLLRLLLLAPCLCLHYGHAWSPLHSTNCKTTGATGSDTSSMTTTRTTTTSTPLWFPRRIQESIDDYRQVVPSAYLRQIVVETQDVARMAVDLYLQCREQDPFGSIASSLSVLDEDKVGWVENNNIDALTLTVTASSAHGAHNQNNNNSNNNALLPPEVQKALFDLSPKTGDVHILPSSIGQYHVVMVEELAVLYRSTTTMQQQQQQSEQSPSTMMVGGHSGQNALVPRSKLKGQGVTPEMPKHAKTYLIHTAGCQMNVADSERLAGVLENALNLTPVVVASSNHHSKVKVEEADVVIFNTCTIRDHAEQKLYDALGPYAQQKQRGKQFALIVTGCVAQQEGEKLLKRVPEVDVVMGPQYVPHLKNVLESVEWGHQVVATSPTIIHQEDDFGGGGSSSSSKPIRGHDLKAWVNVIHGCNEHCTYCVVPAVRGMEQSRSMEHILKECHDLVTNGYKEITLLGQNIDAYGRDMVPKRTFCDLLEFLNANLSSSHPVRIRYVTSHPRYFSDRVIDAVASLDKVCECFHVPFQAGDNAVLKRMRRGYTYESYMRIVHKIRERAPDASICADVIVGFPGETAEAFQRTLDLMTEVKFDNLNTFCYSPRPNTEAATWENQVPDAVKSERLQIVQTLAAQHGFERSTRYVGRTVEVLVEGGNPRNPNQVMGRTRQGRQVFFDATPLEKWKGEFVDVHITEARTWSLMGELA